MHEEDVERGEGAGRQDVVYETDEEEFLPPGKSSPCKEGFATTAEAASAPKTVPGKRKSRKQSEYKLAYFSLWWSRMLREGLKEEEARKSREDRDQLTRMWTSWTTRPEITTRETDVICERPLLIFSEGPTEVNIYLEGRVDALHTGETVDGNCGVGEVTVDNNTTLMDEAQNFPTPEIDDVISEQHQGNNRPGTNLTVPSVGGHGEFILKGRVVLSQ